MQLEIDKNKILIEETKKEIDLMENDFLDKEKFYFLLDKFVKTMTNRILFCEELVIFIEKESSQKEDIDKAKEKILEILNENKYLQEKWLEHFKKEKILVIVKNKNKK